MDELDLAYETTQVYAIVRIDKNFGLQTRKNRVDPLKYKVASSEEYAKLWSYPDLF